MKSQDLLILLKLISLEKQERGEAEKLDISIFLNRIAAQNIGEGLVKYSDAYHARFARDYKLSLDTNSDSILDAKLEDIPDEHIEISAASEWQGWEDSVVNEEPVNAASYTLRSLSESLGLSKSEVGNSLARSRDIGLLITDHRSGLPKANSRALVDLIKYGVRYFFPVKPGSIVRGIPTAFAAPVLEGKVLSAGEIIPVWPDARGKTKGESIEPLFKTVPHAVKNDFLLYHFLALVDAIRIGGPRESAVAATMLEGWILQ